MTYGECQAGKAVQVGHLGLNGCTIGIRERLSRLVVGPLLRGFIQGLVVLVQFVHERLYRRLVLELRLEAVGDRRQRPCDGER